jgi:hypothetical protein
MAGATEDLLGEFKTLFQSRRDALRKEEKDKVEVGTPGTLHGLLPLLG